MQFLDIWRHLGSMDWLRHFALLRASWGCLLNCAAPLCHVRGEAQTEVRVLALFVMARPVPELLRRSLQVWCRICCEHGARRHCWQVRKGAGCWQVRGMLRAVVLAALDALRRRARLGARQIQCRLCRKSFWAIPARLSPRI